MKEQQQKLKPAQQWLRRKQAAQHLGASDGTLANWHSAGTGPPVHKTPTGVLLYDAGELDEWVRSRQEGAEPETDRRDPTDPGEAA